MDCLGTLVGEDVSSGYYVQKEGQLQPCIEFY